jgi:hypothetical protein
MIIKNLSVYLLTAAILASTVFIINPGKESYGQSNATSTIDTNAWIEALKAAHPTLASIPDIADIEEDKGVMDKLKGLEAKEAVKTLIALDIVRDLMQYKAAQEVQ